jgi:anti-anti-sigma factor
MAIGCGDRPFPDRLFPGPYGRGWLGDGPNTEPVTSEGSEIAAVRTAKDSADLELSIVHRPTHTVVRLRGGIDVATAPGLHERLLSLLRRGMGLIILDLSEVSFCDASGLGVLVSGHLYAKVLGVTLRLTAPGPRMTKLLRLHGLDRTLAIYPAPPDALTRGGSRGGSPRPRVRACQ